MHGEPRSILHVDMDAFFAAIEQLDDPRLRGRPLLVGGDGPRGVVATASYEARIFGCHSAQPMAVAKRLCPHAIIVPCRFARYREVSDRLFEIFDSFTPTVQPLSIDEAFLDVTGAAHVSVGPTTPAGNRPDSLSPRLLRGEGWGEGPAARGVDDRETRSPAPDGNSIAAAVAAAATAAAIEIARRLKLRIREELALTASVGVAPNKFLAKLASDLEKPDGLTVISAGDVDRILPPLPVTRIWGIGPKTAARLEGMAIRTIGDLRRATDATLRRLLGAEDAERCRNLACGRDDRPVVTDAEAKQISQENTFGIDIADVEIVRGELHQQVQHVARRLRRHKLRAGGVTLKIRFGDFQTITRSRALGEPTDRTDLLWTATRAVFDDWAARQFVPVRLIGMAARNLSGQDGAQLPLFADPAGQRHERLDHVVDRIVERFGKSAVRRGFSSDQHQE